MYINSFIALNWLVFWENCVFCILATDEQMDSTDALSRSRCRERRLNNVWLSEVIYWFTFPAAAITRTGQITVVLVILSIFGIMVCCLSVTCWTYRCIVRCCFSYCLSPCSGDVTLLIYWICIHYCWIVYVWFKLWDFDLYVDYLLRRGCQLEMFTIIDTVHA